MNSTDRLDRLYNLLPAIYQIRDAEQGYALRALCRLLAREAEVLQDDLAQLYESWFIETCPDWVVPYIGDLIGYEGAVQAGDPSNLDVANPQGEARVLVPRREVANTIRNRRRKGTLALLEDIALDTTGWPARAIEFFRLLAWTQNLNHQHPRRGGTADLHRPVPFTLLDGPFDTLAHTPDVRRPNSTLDPGRYNVPSVGLFVWRLRAYTVTHTRVDALEGVGPHVYTFSALGNDTQLFNRPQPPEADAHPDEPTDLPVPITRRAFEDPLPYDPQRQPRIQSIASADYYGLGKSITIWAPGWPVRDAPQPIPREQIIPANLSNWRYRTPRNYVAVDPELGRIVFPTGQVPRGHVYVSYAYGFAAPIGGGEYSRPQFESGSSVVYRVRENVQQRPGEPGPIQQALTAWRSASPRPKSAVIEIMDSGVYTEPLTIELGEDEALEIRAADGARPIIRMLDYVVDQGDPLGVRGKRGSSLTLDGLLITGRSIAVFGPEGEDADPQDNLCELTIRHCTLVPGWDLRGDCEPLRPAEPSLELLYTTTQVTIEHSIIGSILIEANQVATEPLRISLSDTILDATSHDCDEPECQAVSSREGPAAHATFTFRRCTVFGRVHTHAIEMAENSIFMGRVSVARRQIGCIRFCYVTPGSRTPRRYECQPDRATEGLKNGDADNEALRVRPQFMAVRYGSPDYARLSEACADEIRTGADDRSEMGVYHDLYEPQRAALLRRRLEEFTPAEMAAGLIFTT